MTVWKFAMSALKRSRWAGVPSESWKADTTFGWNIKLWWVISTSNIVIYSRFHNRWQALAINIWTVYNEQYLSASHGIRQAALLPGVFFGWRKWMGSTFRGSVESCWLVWLDSVHFSWRRYLQVHSWCQEFPTQTPVWALGIPRLRWNVASANSDNLNVQNKFLDFHQIFFPFRFHGFDACGNGDEVLFSDAMITKQSPYLWLLCGYRFRLQADGSISAYANRIRIRFLTLETRLRIRRAVRYSFESQSWSDSTLTMWDDPD